MKIGIYPGSFDPITLGHIDIIERASKIVDKLVVAVLINSEKKGLFTIDERLEMMKENLKYINNVDVKSFDGLLIDFAKKENSNLIFRGLREVTDFEYEMQLANINKALYRNIETVFLISNIDYSYVSSSVVKEVASYGGDISKFVPKNVEIKLLEKYKNVL